ncbi:adenylyl-sulfate kinase [Maridesulfovibrio sp. FT414]|uniref:adenylyl-sulfate kinase n=1 Tax=Maridesulfovibrio sp. FT414 TaxID=2979469 RepID=UPI003D8056AB
MILAPFALWIMGPTSAGKTTVAKKLVRKLNAYGCPTLHVDGDEVRALFGKEMGFSPDERLRVVNACLFVLKKAQEANVSVVVSALTAEDSARSLVLELVPRVVICYLSCPIEICAQRDPKGLYLMARRGEIDTLVGYNSEYKAPDSYDLAIDTSSTSIDDAVQIVIDFISDCYSC